MANKLEINKQLIVRCKHGDIKAQYNIYKMYSKYLYNIAMRFFANKMDAEDILQDSFISIFLKIKDFKYGSFQSWARQITVNKCISELRKRKIHFEEVDDDRHIGSVDEEIEDSIPPGLVHEAIKKLPTSARAVANLHGLEGYTHKEVAKMLGISESTSKTQFMRAKQLLLNELKHAKT